MDSSPKLAPEALTRLADEDLITLVGRRSADAFAVLYDRHGGAAYSLAHRIVGDAGVAEDVTQEAFFSLWRSGERFDAARGSVRSWTLGIVRNRAIDALRHGAGSAPRLDLDDEALLDAEPSDRLTDTEAIRRETASRVRSALRDLPTEQSQVISLAYFGGFTHTEIADMLGSPLGTVKGRMRLGLEKIRFALAEGMSVDSPGEESR
ncbi:MAG: sigma-70 family RNA polymerase sigma factor [Solirubrobacterales bacterium]